MEASFGHRVREQRKQKGWTIETLAARVGVGTNYMGDLERGSELLFFTEGTEDTRFCVLAEIARNADATYFVDALIDARLPAGERHSAARRMERSLERWLAGQGIQPAALPLPSPDTINREYEYPTLHRAAAVLLAALKAHDWIEN